MVIPVARNQRRPKAPRRIHARAGVVDGGQMADGDGNADSQRCCGLSLWLIGIAHARYHQHQHEAQEEFDPKSLQRRYALSQLGVAQAGVVKFFRRKRLKLRV